MENMLYFAVFGRDFKKLPQKCGAVYGGFGFQADGSLRVPYTPPEHSVILFDDRIVPAKMEFEKLRQLVEQHKIETVIFDCEKPKSSAFCDLIRSVQGVKAVLPAQYSGVRKSPVLAASYQPKEPFGAYVRRVRQKFGSVMLDVCPIRCSVCGGVWKNDGAQPYQSGRYSAANFCMYVTKQSQGGMEIHFYDTQKTLLLRAAASGLPCLLPLSEFERLKKE